MTGSRTGSRIRACRGALAGSQAGVTLVELAVVLVIITLLAVALFPSLGNVLQVSEAKGAAEQVAGAIRLARQYAVTRGTNHCVAFGGTPNTAFTIREATSDTSCDGTVIQPATTIGHGLAVILPTDLSIVFDPIGNVRNFPPGNPSVTLVVDSNPTACPAATPMNVLVTLYGGVRVSGGTCS